MKNDHIWKNLGKREIIGTYLESSNLLLLFDVYLIEFEKTKFQFLKSSTITTLLIFCGSWFAFEPNQISDYFRLNSLNKIDLNWQKYEICAQKRNQLSKLMAFWTITVYFWTKSHILKWFQQKRLNKSK